MMPTNYPLRLVIKLFGTLSRQSIDLHQLEVSYKPCTMIKVQVVANFIIELTSFG